jgi:hypothetical protein
MKKEVTVVDVLEYYRPNGWVSVDNDFDLTIWIDAEPITKAEFEAGKALVKAQWDAQAKSEEDAKATAQAKLAALGLTTDDLKALGL